MLKSDRICPQKSLVMVLRHKFLGLLSLTLSHRNHKNYRSRCNEISGKDLLSNGFGLSLTSTFLVLRPFHLLMNTEDAKLKEHLRIGLSTATRLVSKNGAAWKRKISQTCVVSSSSFLTRK